MFDYFRPLPDLACPACGQAGLEWRGTDGPCALLVWAQGQAAPVDQVTPEECQTPSERRYSFRLPARFEINADCQCPTSLAAVGTTEHETWTRTELLDPLNAIAYPHENERDFQRRRQYLAERTRQAPQPRRPI